MTYQKTHLRTSKRGKVFVAGRGNEWKVVAKLFHLYNK